MVGVSVCVWGIGGGRRVGTGEVGGVGIEEGVIGGWDRRVGWWGEVFYELILFYLILFYIFKPTRLKSTQTSDFKPCNKGELIQSSLG